MLACRGVLVIHLCLSMSPRSLAPGLCLWLGVEACTSVYLSPPYQAPRLLCLSLPQRCLSLAQSWGPHLSGWLVPVWPGAGLLGLASLLL